MSPPLNKHTIEKLRCAIGEKLILKRQIGSKVSGLAEQAPEALHGTRLTEGQVQATQQPRHAIVPAGSTTSTHSLMQATRNLAMN